MNEEDEESGSNRLGSLLVSAVFFYLGVWLSRSGVLDWIGIGQFIVPEMLFATGVAGVIFGLCVSRTRFRE